ncbi:MAG: LuxR C-terminal-related transcriptional regulator [Pseudonocardiaceae bacterium]
MNVRAGRARAEQDLVRHCHAGLDTDALRGQVLRDLRKLMTIDAAFFATADPDTLLFTGAYAEEALAPVGALFLDNEFGAGDVNRFASLASSPRPVATLDEATRGEWLASPRYRDIMRPIGLGDELRAALSVGSEVWGYLCLHRKDGGLGFTEAEATTLGRVAPHIAHGLRQAVLLDAVSTGSDVNPGVLLLTDDLSLVAATPDAEHLLSLIKPAEATHTLPMPAAVCSVAAALRAIELGIPRATQPTTTVRTRGGTWLRLHASRLRGQDGEGPISVVLEPAGAQSMATVMLRAHGLSPRELEVATAVLRGESTKAISGMLHISTNTVQDHLKAIFDKVGVGSRRELVGRMLGGGR